MSSLSIDSLRSLIDQLPIRPLFLTVSGAHLYGFASADSDVDLRGAHLSGFDDLSGLHERHETVQRGWEHEGREVELVSHSLRKFTRLMAAGENGYVLEQVMSPLVVTAHPDYREFKELAQGCICRRLYRHFAGFLRNEVRLFDREQPKRAKTLLYCYRVGLAGIHVLLTGHIESNLLVLNESFQFSFIDELIAMKQQEGSTLEDSDANWHRCPLRELDERLHQAYSKSALPEKPHNMEALDAFLIRLSLQEMDASAAKTQETHTVRERLQFDSTNLSLGTQVVTRVDRPALNQDTNIKAGNVGVVLKRETPQSQTHLVRVLDGREAEYLRSELSILGREAEGVLSQFVPSSDALADRVIYDCILGSRAYGLATEESDEDHRGIYLAPLDSLCSLWGAPEQISTDPEHVFWELRKFLQLAIQSNPNALECLWTPLVARKHPVAEELRAMRESFLSRSLFRTFGGYAMSQFKKMEGDVRQSGRYRPKHALHLIRLLMAGATALREGFIPVDMTECREKLLPILSGELSLEELAHWRRQLEEDFNLAFEQTTLPDRPDVGRVNDYLVRVRHMQATGEL